MSLISVFAPHEICWTFFAFVPPFLPGPQQKISQRIMLMQLPVGKEGSLEPVAFLCIDATKTNEFVSHSFQASLQHVPIDADPLLSQGFTLIAK